MRQWEYLDADVAYLLGLIVARGRLVENPGDYRIVIEFPGSSLQVQGVETTFDQPMEIRLGLLEIANRLRNLLEADIDIPSTVDTDKHLLAVSFRRRNMAWRNLRAILGDATHFGSFSVPKVLFDDETPVDYAHEFIRGFADVAGNIRSANRYLDRRNRVRLDVLNYRENWQLPVQICQLLQDRLAVPVQSIIWGHPNMGRNFREHQINIFAVPFLKIGFTFRHKQKVLEELAELDRQRFPNAAYYPCPGERRVRASKSIDEREYDMTHLPDALIGQHFNAYWQICRALGCPKRPVHEDVGQLEEVDNEGAI